MIIKLIIVVVLYFLTNYLIKFLKVNPIHKKIVLYLDYVFIYRPTLFFTIWVVICLGMYTAYLTNGYIPQWMFEFNLKTCLLFISISCIMGAIFIREQQEALEKNECLNKDNIRLLFNITLFIGLAIPLFINIYNFILGLILYLFRYFIFRKEKVQNNLLINCLSSTFMGIILLLSGFFIVQTRGNYFSVDLISIPYIPVLVFLLFSLCYLSIFLLIEIFESKKNLFDNRRITVSISTVLLLFVLLISFYINDPLLSICTLVSFPFYIYALLRNMDKDIIRAIRYPLFIFNFFVATIFPYLAIAVIIIFYISKYYYWHRFNLHYPTFLIDND